MNNLKTALRSDWAPAIERAVRTIALVVVAVYVAGYTTGEFLHSLNARLTAVMHGQGNEWITRLGLMASEPMPKPAEAPSVIVRHCAPAPVGITIEEDEIRDLSAQGLSQRAIASRLGISRNRVRRAIA